mgnify:CR=1 FL=1
MQGRLLTKVSLSLAALCALAVTGVARAGAKQTQVQGLLAVPVLAGSAAYALSEVMGWRAGLELAFRMHVLLVGAAGGPALDQLHAADFDHPVTFLPLQTGGFGVEDDLSHARAVSCCLFISLWITA